MLIGDIRATTFNFPLEQCFTHCQHRNFAQQRHTPNACPEMPTVLVAERERTSGNLFDFFRVQASERHTENTTPVMKHQAERLLNTQSLNDLIDKVPVSFNVVLIVLWYLRAMKTG